VSGYTAACYIGLLTRKSNYPDLTHSLTVLLYMSVKGHCRLPWLPSCAVVPAFFSVIYLFYLFICKNHVMQYR